MFLKVEPCFNKKPAAVETHAFSQRLSILIARHSHLFLVLQTVDNISCFFPSSPLQLKNSSTFIRSSHTQPARPQLFKSATCEFSKMSQLIPYINTIAGSFCIFFSYLFFWCFLRKVEGEIYVSCFWGASQTFTAEMIVPDRRFLCSQTDCYPAGPQPLCAEAPTDAPIVFASLQTDNFSGAQAPTVPKFIYIDIGLTLIESYVFECFLLKFGRKQHFPLVH